jgi:hypothetical protein
MGIQGKYKLYLDDERFPKSEGWVIVRNYLQFINYITENGLPDMVSFDHDLGNAIDRTGYDCAKWLCEYCMENDLALPEFNIHSGNPVGRDNIESYLESFKKHFK